MCSYSLHFMELNDSSPTCCSLFCSLQDIVIVRNKRHEKLVIYSNHSNEQLNKHSH